MDNDEYGIQNLVDPSILNFTTVSSEWLPDINKACLRIKTNASFSILVEHPEIEFNLEKVVKQLERRMRLWLIDNCFDILNTEENRKPLYENGLHLVDALLCNDIPEGTIILNPIDYALLNNRELI